MRKLTSEELGKLPPYELQQHSQLARLDTAISAAADALLSVCALQTGLSPEDALARALQALADVMAQAEQEQGNA